MTKIFFVRHAEPVHSWLDDRTRPLTEDGKNDAFKINDVLKNEQIDVFISSPYRRCVDTISGLAQLHHQEIIIDERLRERVKGIEGNN